MLCTLKIARVLVRFYHVARRVVNAESQLPLAFKAEFQRMMLSAKATASPLERATHAKRGRQTL